MTRSSSVVALPLLALCSLLLFLRAPVSVADVLRLSCGNILTYGRTDPIISPGAVVSNHAHVVFGASNFSPTVTYDQLVASNCATCELVEGKARTVSRSRHECALP